VSAATYARKLSRLGTVPDAAVRTSAAAVVKIAEAEGGTVVLGRKQRRVKLSAFARVKPTGPASSEVTVWGKPTGPWVWQSSGTSAHPIPKRKPTAKKPRPMHGDGYAHPVQRMQVQGGGRHGGGAWGRVVKRAARVVPEIFHDELREVIGHG